MLRLRNDDHPVRMARLLIEVSKEAGVPLEKVQQQYQLVEQYGSSGADAVLTSLRQGEPLFEAAFSEDKRDALIRCLGEEKAKEYFKSRVSSIDHSAMLVELAYAEHGHKSFIEGDELHAMLDATDLGEVSTDMLRLPFPAIYISISRTQNQFYLTDPSTGEHKACGIYLFEHEPSIGVRKFEFAGEPCEISSTAPHNTMRQISVVVAALPNENSTHETDDSYQYAELPILENETFESAFDREGRYGDVDKFGVNRAVCTRVMKHVFKFLLYLNTRNISEFESFEEYSKLATKASRSKGKKLTQIKKRLARASDVIYVTHKESEMIGVAGISHGQEKSPHYRRGHFKSVAHGKGRNLRKVVWIRPTVVNKGALGSGDVLKNKVYIVK